MKRHSILPYLFLIAFIISSVSINYSVATSRKDLIEEFCISNQSESGGFTDYIDGSTDITEFTSLANIYILYEIDPSLEKIDKSKGEFWFIDRLNDFTSIASTRKNIPDAYYALQGSVLLNATANNTATVDDAITEMNNFYNETSFGYNGANIPISTISDTYFAVEFLHLASSVLSSEDFNSINSTNITKFVLSCWNSDDNAFGGSPGGEGNPIDSYYAIQTLIRLDKLDQFSFGEELSDFIFTYPQFPFIQLINDDILLC